MKGAHFITDIERKTVRSFIDTRLNFAHGNFKDTPEYVKRLNLQEESQKVVDEILNRLDKDDQISVRRHYEGETARESIEILEYYLQGLRDGVKLLVFLDALHPEFLL